MRPAAIGIIAAKDKIAMTLFAEMIDRKFNRVGNVSGSKIEKRTSRNSVSSTRP